MGLGSACARYGSFTYRQRSGKGNVFSRMCLSVRLFRSVGGHTGPWPPQTCSNLSNLDLTIHGSLPKHVQTCSSWTSHGPIPQTRSNLFKFDLTKPISPSCRKRVHIPFFTMYKSQRYILDLYHK